MKSILLVEDDPFLIDIYTTKLKAEGFQVVVAKDGESSLTKLKQGKFDLVILDIVLPGLDGWEILREIKKEEKFLVLPVIILSNLSQKTEVEKGLKLGAVKYLIKAKFTPSQIIEEVKKILK